MDFRLIDLDQLKLRPVREWRERGWWGRAPLWQRVREVALQQPQKTAVLDSDSTISFASLWRDALRIGLRSLVQTSCTQRAFPSRISDPPRRLTA